MQINQYGRSMVEMLGVLSMVGILTVGGLAIINKASDSQRKGSITSNIAAIASTAKSLSCKFEGGTNGFKSYAQFMNKLTKTPPSLEYVKEGNGYFKDKYDIAYEVNAVEDGDIYNYQIVIKNINEDDCMQIATTYTDKKSSGYSSIKIGDDDMTNNLTPATAAEKCTNDVSVTILYLACN